MSCNYICIKYTCVMYMNGILPVPKKPAAKKVVSISSDESEEEEEVVKKKPISKTSTKPAAKSAKVTWP